MALVDGIIIGLLLIGAIIGLVKGFLNSIFGLIGTLIAMVGAYFLAKPFLSFLQGIFDLQGIVNGWCTGILNNIEAFKVPIDNASQLEEVIGQAQGRLGLLAPIFGKAFTALSESASTLEYPITLASALAPNLATPILMVMAWTVLFILLKIVLFILEHWLNKLLHFTSLKTLDRLLGMVIGVAKAGIFILVLLTFATFLFPNAEHIVMRHILDSKIAVWINSWNPIPAWLSSILPF